MADNVAITAGTGTTIAADDIGGVLFQRVKIAQGADGSGTDVSSAAPLQVSLANGTVPSHAVTNAGTFAVQAAVADGADVTQGAIADAAYTGSGSTTVVGALKGIYSGLPLVGALGTASPQVLTVQGGLSGLPLASPDAGNLSSGTGTSSVTSATNLFSVDTSGYNAISVQVTSAGSATITYEASNDNSTWIAVTGISPAVGTSATVLNTYGATSSTTALILNFPVIARYFRARVSAYTSGTVTVFYSLRKNFNTAFNVANVTASTAVVSPSTSAASTTNSASAATGLNVALCAVLDDVAPTAITENNFGSVRMGAERGLYSSNLASANGGYSFLNIVAGQATTTVKSGAGTLHSIVFNSAASATNVTTVYDNTAGSGTVIAIPAATTATVPTTLIFDIAFATGLTIVTATANGSNMTVCYK